MLALPGPLLALVAIFLIEVFLFNIIKPDLPKIPGDIYLDKSGIKLYIPIASALALSVIASYFLHLL